MIKITNIKIKADLSDDELFEKIYKKYKINKNDVTERRIIKKSIDARNKADIFYNYSVELECKNENKIKNVQIVLPHSIVFANAVVHSSRSSVSPRLYQKIPRLERITHTPPAKTMPTV